MLRNGQTDDLGITEHVAQVSVLWWRTTTQNWINWALNTGVTLGFASRKTPQQRGTARAPLANTASFRSSARLLHVSRVLCSRHCWSAAAGGGIPQKPPSMSYAFDNTAVRCTALERTSHEKSYWQWEPNWQLDTILTGRSFHWLCTTHFGTNCCSNATPIN